MATSGRYGLRWAAGEDDLLLTSVGTGLRPAVDGALAKRKANILFHARKLPTVFMNGSNIEGSRLVFEESVKAGVERICYASSVAAYGFHADNPDWLTEEIPARGSAEHPYSAQKAEVERVLAATLLHRRRTHAYVFRPCIVAGPEARTMIEEIPYFRLGEAMPDFVVRLLGSLPALKPVIPDPGARFQLVHSEDVARAFVSGVRGVGEPGPYNLAAGGTLTMSHLADALGWYAVPVPRLAVNATAEVVTRLPLAPAQVAWLHSVRKPVLMKTDRARRLLKWRPQHTARRTLADMVRAQREQSQSALR